jgi:hypothetical protein
VTVASLLNVFILTLVSPHISDGSQFFRLEDESGSSLVSRCSMFQR